MLEGFVLGWMAGTIGAMFVVGMGRRVSRRR